MQIAIKGRDKKNMIRLLPVVTLLIFVFMGVNSFAVEHISRSVTIDSSDGPFVNTTHKATARLIAQDLTVSSDSDSDSTLFFAPQVILRPGGSGKSLRINSGAEFRAGPPTLPVHVAVLCGSADCQAIDEDFLRARVFEWNRDFYTETETTIFNERLHPVRLVYKSGTTYSELEKVAGVPSDPCYTEAVAGSSWSDFAAEFWTSCSTSGTGKVKDVDAINIYIIENVWDPPNGHGTWNRGDTSDPQPVAVVHRPRIDPAEADYQFHAAPHEIGHTLGIDHTYDNTLGNDNDPSELMASVGNNRCSSGTPFNQTIYGNRSLGIYYEPFVNCDTLSNRDQYDHRTCGHVEVVMDCSDDWWRMFNESYDGSTNNCYDPCP